MKNTSSTWNNRKNFPKVDEESFFQQSADYSIKNHVFFTHPEKKNVIDIAIPFDRLDQDPHLAKKFDLPATPFIDVVPSTAKLKFLPNQKINELYRIKTSHFYLALSLHIALVFFYFLGSFLTKKSQSEPEIVEINFGLTDMPTQSRQSQTKTNVENEQAEATKTQQQLPQLTKNVTPDTTPEPPAKEEPIPQPVKNEKNDLVVKEPEKKVKIEPEKIKPTGEKPKPLGPPPEADKQKIKLEDYLKRKELDSRKEANKKTEGMHDKAKEKAKEQKKYNPNDVPPSPLASDTPSSIPNPPPGLTGSLSGRVTAKSYNSYKAYLARQLKQNWTVSEGSRFPGNLKATVEFTVNPYGYLVGTPEITKSSGNPEFDSAVINSLEGTFPVSTPPPADIKPPQTFKADYSAKNVQ